MGGTVLDLFLAAAEVYGVPSRLKGDHGVENILVAAWMDLHCGVRRGSYIWWRYVCSMFTNIMAGLTHLSRSVHNVQIE
jgi:hypothetical protein